MLSSDSGLESSFSSMLRIIEIIIICNVGNLVILVRRIGGSLLEVCVIFRSPLECWCVVRVYPYMLRNKCECRRGGKIVACLTHDVEKREASYGLTCFNKGTAIGNQP